MRNIIIVLSLLLAVPALSGAARAADGKCLNYEPAVVTLTGKITRQMGYGPPNFGDDPAHDAKEPYWRLDLDQPFCINEILPDYEGEPDVRDLQIVYMRGYPKGKDWIGHRVRITGTLFHSNTGHHHTDVLITAEKTEKLP